MEKQDAPVKRNIKFDYKNLYPLKKYISEKGKITPRRITYIPIILNSKIVLLIHLLKAFNKP